MFLESSHLACLEGSVAGFTNVVILAFAENGLVNPASFFGVSEFPGYKLTHRFLYASLSILFIIFYLFCRQLETLSNGLMFLSCKGFLDSFVGLCSPSKISLRLRISNKRILTGDVVSFRLDLRPQRCQSRFDLLKTARGRCREVLETALFLLLGSAHPHSTLFYSGMIK